jgi:Tfp pilus assembly major pilin PilA
MQRNNRGNMRRNNRGITLIGFAILLCVAGFFAYLAMKLVPMYIEYFGVVKAMESIKTEPGAAQKSLEEIRRDLSFKFDSQYVDDASVPPQAISVKREAGGATLRIAYEKRVNFMYNIDLVGVFDKSVILRNVGGE